MFEQPLLFIGCSNIPFFNPFFVTYGIPCCARGHHSHLTFCDLRDTMPCQRSLLPFLTTIVVYGMPCLARIPQSHFPLNPYLGKQRISLGVVSIPRNASSHIISLLATILITNSGLIFICVKIMNVYTCAKEISKLVVLSS